MGRRTNIQALSGKQRAKRLRDRRKKRKEMNRRVNEILQQSHNSSGSLNNSENQIDASSHEANLKNDIRDWANTYHISKNAINSLLSLLGSNGIKGLPKNYRTLQKTPLNVEITNSAGGNFWYKGIANCLKIIFPTLSQDLTISLNFNIDGLPLYKSSKISFWPILASIFGTSLKYILTL